MLSKSHLQQIIAKFLRTGNKNKIIKITDKLNLSEIVAILVDLMPAEQKNFIELLFEIGLGEKIINRLPKGTVNDLLCNLKDRKLVEILKSLETKERTSLLRYLSEERSHRIIAYLEGEEASKLSELLLHPEDSAADLMNTKFLTLSGKTLVKDALEYPRKMKREVSAYYIYILDEKLRLIGIVPIHELLLVKPDKTLEQIMDRDVIQVQLDTPKGDVAEIITRYNLLSIPVVDEMGVVQGVISIDNIIEVIQDAATDDMYKIAGLDKEDRVFVKPMQSVKKRLPWLSINILTALTGAMIISHFEDTYRMIAALVIFMPVIAGLGGNTGAQTLTVVVRGLALGEVQLSSAKKVILKEFLVGLTNGVIIGILVAAVAILWKGSPFLGVIIALAILSNLIIASLIGSIVPMTLKYLGFDPAIASNIFVTATTDACGFLIYLGLATIFIDFLR